MQIIPNINIIVDEKYGLKYKKATLIKV